MAASVVMCSPAFAQESGTPVECPEQPAEVLPGVYASSIEHTITFSKDGDTLDFTAGNTGYADESRITCLEETPEFIRRDRLPAPGEFAVTGGSCGFSGGGGGAEHVGLSSEWPRMERRMADRIDRFVKEGYPTNSIILHAVSSGLTIDKTVYLMTRADGDRAEEFFTTAFAMQDSLPGWACSAAGATARGGAYSPYYDVNDLPPRRSVAEVARRFFEENRIMEPMPDWFAGDFHMLAYTDELIELAGDNRWYTRGGRSAVENGRLTKPIMISLYGETQDVVIDISREELLPFQERGVGRLPVVFYFNKDFQFTATDVRFDGTLSDAIELFTSQGAELTPVPWLGGGDYHVMVPAEDFDDWFEIPSRDDIDPQRYEQLSADLARDGFARGPVIATLYSEQNGRWVNDPERVRVAMESGYDEIPVAFLYHRLGRVPCGASTADCMQVVCDALICAGGSPAACDIEPALEQEFDDDDELPIPALGGSASPAT